MNDSVPVFTLRADWVLPITGEPIRGAAVVIRGERIVSVGRDTEGPVHEYPESILLPGFVNAHTHLEFSDLTAPIAPSGTALPDWIRVINSQRRARTSEPSRAIELGLNDAVQSGTTTIGEIETSGWSSVRALPANVSPANVFRFRELIGLTESRIAECLGAATAHLKQAARPNEQLGLSPHAPYTVHPQLLAQAIEMARPHGAPLAMHVAESREELELLSAGTGPFRALLEEAGVWVPEAFEMPRRPLDVLEMLASAPRALVIHGNYLDDGELDFLAQRRNSMAVVYCPRTHAYFAHKAYPLSRMLDSGVQVAIGTDSRASNPDLSMLGELRQLAQSHPNISPQRLLRLMTLDGAIALGGSDTFGSLQAGKLANLAVVQAQTAGAVNPFEALIDPSSQVIATVCRGQQVFSTD